MQFLASSTAQGFAVLAFDGGRVAGSDESAEAVGVGCTMTGSTTANTS